MGDSSWFGLDEIVLEIRGFKYECFNFFLDFVVCVFIFGKLGNCLILINSTQHLCVYL